MFFQCYLINETYATNLTPVRPVCRVNGNIFLFYKFTTGFYITDVSHVTSSCSVSFYVKAQSTVTSETYITNVTNVIVFSSVFTSVSLQWMWISKAFLTKTTHIMRNSSVAYDMTLQHVFIHVPFATIICSTDKWFLPFVRENVIFQKIRSSVAFPAAWDMANIDVFYLLLLQVNIKF